MRIVRYLDKGRPTLGVRDGQDVVALQGEGAPTDVADLLRQGPDGMMRATQDLRSGGGRQPLGSLHVLPPTKRAGKIICLGLNYVDHAAEGGKAPPTYPMIFLRAATSLVGHGAPMIKPDCSDQFDYEAELVAFIGKAGRHVSREDALSHVAGYSIFNDGSVRDYQRKTPQWTIGKNFDDSGGFGPEFVTAEELPPGALGLRIQARLNGAVVQDANTADMVFGVAETIHLISQCMTLQPGDLLVMGTPGGVGVARTPPLFLKPGDVAEVEIETIGVLRNPIGRERPGTLAA